MDSVYYRFAVGALDADSRRTAGVFSVLEHVRRRALPPRVLRRIHHEFDWMNENLPVPRLPAQQRRAIFWFRPGAGEPLRRMRDLATWLRAHGVHVDNLKSHDPGRLVYEDRFQVAAVPRNVPEARRWTVGEITVEGQPTFLMRRSAGWR